MTVLIVIIVGMVLVMAGVLSGPVAFILFGDEMPRSVEEWGPLLVVASLVLGTVLVFGGIMRAVLL